MALNRKEAFLAAIAGEDVGELKPKNRQEAALDKIAKGGGGDVLNENGKLKNEVLPDGYPYEEEKEIVLFAKQAVNLDDQETQYRGRIQIDNTFVPTGGETIEMTIDGKVYKCLTKANSSGSADWGAEWSEDINGFHYDDYPFACSCDWRGEIIFTCPPNAMSTTPVVGIKFAKKIVVPMAGEFLPTAEYVPDATGTTVTSEMYNLLLASLRAAGYLES